jgi:uncharacterized phiE125 gp8 family phage protein
MGLVLVTPPSGEPVVLADVKLNSRVIDSTDDTLFPLLISTARRYAESYTGRSFFTQTWKLVLDCFPDCPIQLEKGDVQSVASITYMAMDGTQQTMPTTDYVVDTSSAIARITPVFGKIWPIPMPQMGSVQVTYVAGYGTSAASVPEGIRQWIQMRVATLYENREEVAILSKGKLEPLPFVDGLLDPYRVPML